MCVWESYQGLFSPGQRQGCEQEQLKAQGREAAWGWTWGLEDRAEEGSLPLKPTVYKLQNFFVFSSKYQKIYGSLSMFLVGASPGRCQRTAYCVLLEPSFKEHSVT